MPTYAESKLAAEHYGFPIFYELLPLDVALAEEASAIESDRDAFGEEFDGYQASQLDMVRSVYAAGSAAGTAYSVRVPNGECRDARVPEELLHKARVGVPGDQPPGGVTEGMEAQRAQPGGVACRLEAATHGRRIEAPAET
jgi:hypothetical protein